MRTTAKVVLVSAGYVGALAIAFAVVALNVEFTNGPDRQASSGMYAFSDSLLFLAAFGAASIPATDAALYFLRPFGRIWRWFAVAAVVIATTEVVAFFALTLFIPF